MPLANSDMKPGRFLRYHNARRKIALIVKALHSNQSIIISTHTKHIKYTKRHADLFKATKSGALVKQGRSWLCIDGAKITFHAPQ